MKKLLIILMVVAMASFLFVGCFGTTPPIEDEEEEDVITPPTTVAPVITSVPDIVGGYINKAAAADGIVVNGTAPTYSEVKVYINGLTAGTGDTGFNGVFSVVVANADLIKSVKTDGAKVLYATATDVGLAESASSNVKNFILDTVVPKISSSKAKAGTASAIPKAGTAITSTTIALNLLTAVTGTNVATDAVMGAGIVDGTWYLLALSPTTVQVTGPNVFTHLTGLLGNEVYPGTLIPGVTITFKGFGLILAGDYVNIVCVAQVAAVIAVPGYIDVTFNEPVTGASMLTGVWTAFGATTDIEPVVTVRGTDLARLTEDAATLPDLVTGVAYSVSVSGIIDLAGNTISASAPSTSIGIVLP